MKNWKTTLAGLATAIAFANPHATWSPLVGALGAFLGGLSTADYDHDTKYPGTPSPAPRRPIVLLLCLACLAYVAVGCARFNSDQVATKPDGTRTESHQDITTFMASKTAIAKLRAATTDKSQGLTVGAIDQEANGSDLVAAAVKAAIEAAK